MSHTKSASRFATVLFACLVGLVWPGAPARAQRDVGVRPSSSGGPLMPEQAAYDVTRYDLDLRIDPEKRSIAGTLTATVRIVHPVEWLVLDLDDPLAVSAVAAVDEGATSPLRFERRGGRLWVAFPAARQPGETAKVRVAYGGAPRVAPRPPWAGGFSWEKTPSGAHWIGVSCQNDGADVWWPCKDHPSDEADEVSIRITVPKPLYCSSNGVLREIAENDDGTRTFDWLVTQPINNYNVTVNIAPYELIETTYRSVAGSTFPVVFYAIPEDAEKARALVPEMLDYMRFFEQRLGPYPFRAEKLGVAQTTYLGMEHQTAIAYGQNYRKNDYGFDGLLFHELGHEWWGNLVTAYDWRDMWLHEGFQSYMDALYAGHVKGEEGYRRYVAGLRQGLRNKQPVAPRESRTTTEIYMAAPDYVKSDGDIYSKGAVVLHALRYVVGDDAFFAALRRMAYPTPAAERVTDGRQCRFATTDDFLRVAERESGRELGWFFEVYLRQPELPRLVSERVEGGVRLRWEAPGGLPFPMPVEVRAGGQTRRVEMAGGTAVVPVPAGQSLEVDPDGWVLRAE